MCHIFCLRRSSEYISQENQEEDQKDDMECRTGLEARRLLKRSPRIMAEQQM